MESYFALVVAIIVVVAVALGLAAYNNRADEPVPKPERQPKSSKKNNKKEKKQKTPEQQQGNNKDGKKKKNKPTGQPIKFTWDGKVENEDESMIELLRGTGEYIAKAAQEEVRKKARAVAATVGQTAEKVKGKAASATATADDAEFEYVLMRRKKVEDKAAKSKKKVKDTAATTDAANPATEEATEAPAADGKGGKRQKSFFKKGVFAELRNADKLEKLAKQQEEDEKANSRTGKKKTGDAAAAEEEPAKDERKTKPKKTGDAEEEDVAVGPRQQRPPRQPREFVPRDPPPVPPRPAGGHFETASLDDMLSAISTHYGPKPKQNFAKLPPPVLFRLLKLLSVRDIVALSTVNHFLSKVSRDDRLWRNYCEKDFAMKFSNKNQPQSKKKFRNVYKDEYLKSKK